MVVLSVALVSFSLVAVQGHAAIGSNASYVGPLQGAEEGSKTYLPQ